MRRFPPYMIVAVCGILFLSAGMVIITADNDPVALPEVPIDPAVLTPTDLVSLPAEQPALPEVQPTEIPPAQPAEVVAPTSEVVVVPPATGVEQVQQSVPVVVPTVENAAAQVPVVPAPADSNAVVVTPVIVPQSAPLGTLPPPVDVLPTLELPVIEATTVLPIIQPTLPNVVVPAANTQVMGQVHVPLRSDFTGINIVLTLPDGQVMQTRTDAAGNFAFANLVAGNYRLDAHLTGYLSSQANFSLTDGQVLLLPTANLIGGDTNLDNRIDLTDAALIAANFDGLTPVAGADLNQDGIVDIRDLTTIGAFFGQAGPTAWQP